MGRVGNEKLLSDNFSNPRTSGVWLLIESNQARHIDCVSLTQVCPKAFNSTDKGFSFVSVEQMSFA